MHPYTLSARLKNGWFDHTSEPEIIIPQAFIDCRALWDNRGDRSSWPKEQWSFVKAAIEPLLYATIDPEDEHYAGGLLNPKGTLHSQSVELLSVSFEQGPIPIVSARAYFELTFDRQFVDNGAFYNWMEATDWLEWCTNFGWRFPCDNEYDAAESNDGMDIELSVQAFRI